MYEGCSVYSAAINWGHNGAEMKQNLKYAFVSIVLLLHALSNRVFNNF